MCGVGRRRIVLVIIDMSSQTKRLTGQSWAREVRSGERGHGKSLLEAPVVRNGRVRHGVRGKCELGQRDSQEQSD
jgi:hypothetical protein